MMRSTNLLTYLLTYLTFILLILVHYNFHTKAYAYGLYRIKPFLVGY